METVDWLIVGGYFAILFALAWWVILKNRDTADDYFLAGRNLGWFIGTGLAWHSGGVSVFHGLSLNHGAPLPCPARKQSPGTWKFDRG